MDIQQYMQKVGRQARDASRAMARADSNAKNRALLCIAAAIRRETAALIAANQEDLAAARVAGLDNNGRLMNSINLVIGGGMAAGPALAGALLQHFASADPLLAAAGVCALLSLILIAAASAAGKS